jgi:hypothetical protein
LFFYNSQEFIADFEQSGGFAWSPWALKIPDVDDTVTVIMAMLKQDPKSLPSPNVTNAIEVRRSGHSCHYFLYCFSLMVVMAILSAAGTQDTLTCKAGH